jgi:PAN domain
MCAGSWQTPRWSAPPLETTRGLKQQITWGPTAIWLALTRTVSSSGECAQNCKRLATCNAFAYNKRSGSCYLYSRADTKPNANYVSGIRK